MNVEDRKQFYTAIKLVDIYTNQHRILNFVKNTYAERHLKVIRVIPHHFLC